MKFPGQSLPVPLVKKSNARPVTTALKNTAPQNTPIAVVKPLWAPRIQNGFMQASIATSTKWRANSNDRGVGFFSELMDCIFKKVLNFIAYGVVFFSDRYTGNNFPTTANPPQSVINPDDNRSRFMLQARCLPAVPVLARCRVPRPNRWFTSSMACIKQMRFSGMSLSRSSVGCCSQMAHVMRRAARCWRPPRPTLQSFGLR